MIKLLELLPFLITSIATAIATLQGHKVYQRKKDQAYPQCPTCMQSIRPIAPDAVCAQCGLSRAEHDSKIAHDGSWHMFKPTRSLR